MNNVRVDVMVRWAYLLHLKAGYDSFDIRLMEYAKMGRRQGLEVFQLHIRNKYGIKAKGPFDAK